MTTGTTAVVPIKSWRTAKSRLEVSAVERCRLAKAFAMDVLDAVADSGEVTRLVIVSIEPDIAATAKQLGAVLLPDRAAAGDPLNEAVDVGRRWAAHHAPSSPVAVIPADLPALTTRVLDETLTLMRSTLPDAVGVAFVPDLGTGTTLAWATDPEHLHTAYGRDSARRHEAAGATRVVGADPRVRQDVDTLDDLRAAMRLGVGGHTREVLDARETAK